MTGFLEVIGALVAGSGMGVVYFGGLWATVRRLATAGNPAAVVFISFTVRLAIAVAVFAALARTGRWPLVTSALVGFLLARTVMVRRLRPAGTLPARDVT